MRDIFAAGDCAETWHRITQSNAYLPLGTTAHKQGRVAGENAVGGNRILKAVLVRNQCGCSIMWWREPAFMTATRRMPALTPVSVDSMVWDHKVHYPGAKEMTIRVTGDRGTGRLLGAQIIGHFGTEVSKRIDIFAAAIHHGMNVEQVNDFDLSYTPPLSSPWDPVQIAAQAWTIRQKAA